MIIYLAGPLFTTAERNFNAQLAALLRENHDVWVPQEADQHNMSPRDIFDDDVKHLEQAEVIVANMDGPDPDSGTCWECGYAYGVKRIIAFRTDFRAVVEIGGDLLPAKERDKAPYNPMLTESADIRLDLPQKSVTEVAASIEAALDALPSMPRRTRPAQAFVEITSTSAERREPSPRSRGTKKR